MTTQLHDQGEEFITKAIFESDIYSIPASVTIGLFHDGEVSGDTTAGDDLTDSATPSSITTGTGVTNSVSLDSSGFDAASDASTNWKASNANTLTFDLSGVSSGTMDAWYMELDYDQNNDSANETVLIATGPLSQKYDLASVDTFDLNADGAGFSIN